MCTAITYKTKDHYFGRNLDLEYSYNETITIVPRKFEFKFREVGSIKEHYAMIGMAYVMDNYPLFYDATNEKGLSMAGLNFPGNAVYRPCMVGQDNVSPFEFIPWILTQCKDVTEAKNLLSRINLASINFSEELPLSPLHWIIADRDSAITVEAVKDGIKVHDNPIGVLTNNPPFEYQMFNLNNYMTLSKNEPVNTFADGFMLNTYSRGMGAMGLPGDLSSMSRFVRAAFARLNSVSEETEEKSVSQFFHILGAIEMQRGLVVMGDGKYDITIYSSCCNTDKGIYYYKTYDNWQIMAVDMHKEELDGSELVSYKMLEKGDIKYQN